MNIKRILISNGVNDLDHRPPKQVSEDVGVTIKILKSKFPLSEVTPRKNELESELKECNNLLQNIIRKCRNLFLI